MEVEDINRWETIAIRMEGRVEKLSKDKIRKECTPVVTGVENIIEVMIS